MPKRQGNSEKHLMFGHLLLKLGEGIDIHAIWKGVSRQARVHGGGGGAKEHRPPPIKNWKKRCCQRKFLPLTNVLLIKLGGGGGRHTLHTCNIWKGVDGQALVHGGGLAPSLENKKKNIR